MMKFHTFKIRTKTDPQEAFVEIDGMRLEGVSRVAFDISSGRFVTLTLEIYADVEVDGEYQEKAVLVAMDPPAIELAPK